MIGRTARHNMHILQSAQVARFKPHQFAEIRLGGAQSVLYGLGLVINFFEHKMLITALFGRFLVPRYFGRFERFFLPVFAKQRDPFGGQRHHFAVFQKQNFVGMF